LAVNQKMNGGACSSLALFLLKPGWENKKDLKRIYFSWCADEIAGIAIKGAVARFNKENNASATISVQKEFLPARRYRANLDLVEMIVETALLSAKRNGGNGTAEVRVAEEWDGLHITISANVREEERDALLNAGVLAKAEVQIGKTGMDIRIAQC
jgi:hypothetical protein